MSSKVVSITSSQQFKSVVASSTYVVVDFYADWCGPCKVISPVFEQLAAQESKPGRIAFAKVNVDSQRDVASTYGVTAMPTFLILKGSKVVETVRGANTSALRSAVLSAAADAARGPTRQAAAFSGAGHTLGAGAGSATGARKRPATGESPGFNLGDFLNGPAGMARGQGMMSVIVRFLGLYFTSLLSFEPMKAAEYSPYAVRGTSNVKTR